MASKSREEIQEESIRSAYQRSINQGVYTLLLECLRGWYRRRRCRRRHRACLDGTNKIRPNFTVQTAKQWYWFYFHISPGRPSTMRMEGSAGSTISTTVSRAERGRQIKQWFKEGGGRVLDRKVLVRARGRTRILRVHIERRMSDVQRARHVEVESLAEVRREKRNRDVVGDGVDGMKKKDERERVQVDRGTAGVTGASLSDSPTHASIIKKVPSGSFFVFRHCYSWVVTELIKPTE